MVYSLERLALTKRQEAKLEEAECFIETCANICGNTVYKAKKQSRQVGGSWKSNMQRLTEEDDRDRVRWRQMMCCERSFSSTPAMSF